MKNQKCHLPLLLCSFFPSFFSKKSNNDNSPHPLHFGLPVCFFIVFLACSYNCFLSGATSDRYSARKPRTCLEIYSDSVLFVVVAARRASSLISLTNSVCVFEVFPFVGIKDQFGSPLLHEEINYSFLIAPIPDNDIPINSTPYVTLNNHQICH